MNDDSSGNSVVVLWFIPKGDEYAERALLIGVYRTMESCQEAIDRLKIRPGFRDHLPGFTPEKYELDRDGWTEGFISIEEALRELR